MAKAIKPTIRFAADFDAYKRELKRAIGQTDKFDRTLKGAGKRNNFRSIGKAAFGAAAGIGAVAVAGTELKKSVDETVDLAKATRQLQRATGLSAEEASRLAAVLKVRGVGTDKLGRSFVTLARQIEAAKTGSGAAADNFRKLGVSQRDIQRGNVSRILAASADGFKRMGDSTGKAAIAQQLFGRNSRDLIPLLEGGGKALRDQLALAPQLSQAQVEQAFAATKAQRQINLALMKVRTTIGVALLPYISKAANFISEMFEGGDTKGGRFAAKLKEIWNAIKPALEDLGKLAKVVFEFLAANPKLVKMAAYLGAVGLAIKAIKFGSAISGMSTFLGAARTLGGKLITSLRGSGTKAGSAAMSAAANSAADSAAGGVMTAGGRGKKFERGGKGIGRWVGRGLAFGVIAGLIIFGPQLAKELSDWFSRNLPGWLKALLGIRGSSDPRSPYFGAQGLRSIEPGARGAMSAASGSGMAVSRASSSAFARTAISVDSNSSPGLVQQRITELEKSIATYENALAKVEDRTDSAGKKARDRFKERLADLRYELSNLERRQQGESAIEGILQRIADLRIQTAKAAADELGTSLNQREAERARLRSLAAAAEFSREQARLSTEASTADRDYVSQRAELVTQRDMAATEATDPRVQARYAREREKAQRDLARAEARGDLDAKDAALAQLAALEERYGANRAARLQAEIEELDRLEQERRDNAQRALDELRLSEQERLDALKAEAIEAQNTAAAIGALASGLGNVGSVADFLRRALMFSGGGTGGPETSSPGAVQDFLRALLGVPGFSLDTGEVPLFGQQPSGAKKPTIPRKPKSKKRASGGFLSSTPGALTLVGETGPEYVTRDGLVLSGSRTQRMGSAGGVTLNVYPRTSANDPVELARALGWQLATR